MILLIPQGTFLLRGVILPTCHKLLTLQLNPRAVHGEALASVTNPAIVCEDVFDKVSEGDRCMDFPPFR